MRTRNVTLESGRQVRIAALSYDQAGDFLERAGKLEAGKASPRSWDLFTLDLLAENLYYAWQPGDGQIFSAAQLRQEWTCAEIRECMKQILEMSGLLRKEKAA